jgi:hypothetical protein
MRAALRRRQPSCPGYATATAVLPSAQHRAVATAGSVAAQRSSSNDDGGLGLPNIIGMPKHELAAVVAGLGIKPFVAKQIWNWVYSKGATSFSSMRNISKLNQQKLAAACQVWGGIPETEARSTDGTRKWLLRFDERTAVEAVYRRPRSSGPVCTCCCKAGPGAMACLSVWTAAA